MKKESSIVTSSLITFWLEELKLPKTLFTLSISALPNATKVVTASTFPSEMARILPELPDMPQSTLTLVTNNQEETTSKPLVTYSYISWKGLSHGKAFQEDQRLKSMQISRRRRRKLPLKNCARTNRMSSRNSCTTAEGLVSLKIQTTGTLLACLRAAWNATILTRRCQTSFGTRIDLSLRRKPSRGKCWTSSTKSRPTRPQRTNDSSKCELL